MGNWFKTTVLFAAILALFMMIGGLIGGREGMMMALLLGGGMNFFAYWFSDKMVLRMYHAQPVDARFQVQQRAQRAQRARARESRRWRWSLCECLATSL